MNESRCLACLLASLTALTALLSGCAGSTSGAPATVAAATAQGTASSVSGNAPVANRHGPTRLRGITTPTDLVKALQEHGAKSARNTGEKIIPLFGAESGHVIELLGQPVQVYVMSSPATALAAEKDPSRLLVQWIAPPHVIAVGNLIITVVTPDDAMARKILAYVQAVQG